MDPSDIIDSVNSYLLADASIVEKFGEKIKVTPFTSSVTGCVKANVKYFTAFITYQLESKKAFGVASVVANQDSVQHIEVHVDEKTIAVSLQPTLMDYARSYLLRDKRIRKALGKGLKLEELSKSHEENNVEGKVFSHTCASYEVEGSKKTGIASVNATHNGITEITVFIEEEMFTIDLPQSQKVPSEPTPTTKAPTSHGGFAASGPPIARSTIIASSA